MLSGIPGSGKTSLIKALCNKFHYSLSIISVSKFFDNDGLLNAISTVDSKSFLLLEDIDGLFVKREANALIRIGRMDMILEFNYPSKNDIEKLFNDITKEKVKTLEKDKKELIKEMKGLKKEEDNLSYKEFMKIRNEIYSKIHKLTIKRRKEEKKKYDLEKAIESIPIKPIILLKKKANKKVDKK